MLLLSNVPDCALQVLVAPDLESVILNSFDELSGRPGIPEYWKSQWQVYFCVQDVNAIHAVNTITTIKEGRNFMYKFTYLREGSDSKLKFKIQQAFIKLIRVQKIRDPY